MTEFKLTFDKGSVRTIDEFGRMHVKVANISKANICDYLGEEIPGFDELGLDPKAVYKLYRDPEELKKAVPSCNNIQLMSVHVAVTADEPQKKVVAGSTGTDGVFNAPYLQNSLVIWDKDDIENIENGSVKELSCGYAYTPDMTPGQAQGVRYDGVMRDIVFNHVALVKQGRAGSDVVVGDSQPLFMEKQMGKQALSAKAQMVKGAVLAHLTLAADQMPALNKILANVSQVNFSKQKRAIAKGIHSLAGDTSRLEEVNKFLDRLDSAPGEGAGGYGVEDDDPDSDVDYKDGKGEPKGETKVKTPGEEDDDEDEQDGAEALVPDEDGAVIAKLEELLKMLKGDKPGDDTEGEDEDPPGETSNIGADEPEQSAGGANADPKSAKNKAMIPSQKAMDAAIKLACDATAKATEARTISRLRSIAEAEEIVRPYVGKLAAMDSAEKVYKAALDFLKVDVTGVPSAAFKHILLARPAPGQAAHRPVQANDSSSTSNVIEAFPNLSRLG